MIYTKEISFSLFVSNNFSVHIESCTTNIRMFKQFTVVTIVICTMSLFLIKERWSTSLYIRNVSLCYNLKTLIWNLHLQSLSLVNAGLNVSGRSNGRPRYVGVMLNGISSPCTKTLSFRSATWLFRWKIATSDLPSFIHKHHLR